MKPLIESHAIILSSKLFQISITLCAKEYFLTSTWHLGLINFKECPLVGAVFKLKNMHGSKFSKPLNISKTSIRSPSKCPMSVSLKVVVFLHSYVFSFNDVMSLVDLLCTPSIRSISFLKWGLRVSTCLIGAKFGYICFGSDHHLVACRCSYTPWRLVTNCNVSNYHHVSVSSLIV